MWLLILLLLHRLSLQAQRNTLCLQAAINWNIRGIFTSAEKAGWMQRHLMQNLWRCWKIFKVSKWLR